MSDVVKAYPLQWPAGWKRARPDRRFRGSFSKGERSYSTDGASSRITYKDLTVADAVQRVAAELRRMGVTENDMVISTNLKLRMDGLPRSDQPRPQDPGVAVYWIDRASGTRRCMAIDMMYDIVEHNLAAIAATLDAMRAIERHGGAAILDRAFTGFTALPPPLAAARPWREVLGVAFDERDAGRIRECYRICRSKTHPDKGCSSEAYQAVDRAYEQAQRELGFQP